MVIVVIPYVWYQTVSGIVNPLYSETKRMRLGGRMVSHGIKPTATTGNLLLDSLSPTLRGSTVHASLQCDFDPKELLIQLGTSPKTLVFLTSGLASRVVRATEDLTCDVGMVGCDALIDSRLLLGSAVSTADWILQLPSNGLCAPTGLLQYLFRSSEEFRNAVLANAQQQHDAFTQLACCTARHDADQRLSRWLLVASTLSGSGCLSLRQDFLAQILGVRRSTVSSTLASLEKQRFIRVHRDTIWILKRSGLIEAACECYGAWQSSLHPVLLKRQTAPRLIKEQES
jgi:CRP-like cAMP-binding protein